MIYAVRHLTTYRYAAPVAHARCSLRLTPADGDGQNLLESAISITPAPRIRAERRDAFGLPTVGFTLDRPHRELAIEARSRVEVRRDRSAPAELAWQVVRDRALLQRSLEPDSPVHFLYASRRAPLSAEVTDYARQSFPDGEGFWAGALDVMRRMRNDFTFDARATTVSTTPDEAFRARRGVCQDFAHIMIAGLRGLGLPAAYISGYLRTVPPPGLPRLRGADASHAWVSLWCDGRWADLDPTNGVAVADDHILVARGRDYGDVAPVDGIILGSGAQRLRVEVDVIPEGEGNPEDDIVR